MMMRLVALVAVALALMPGAALAQRGGDAASVFVEPVGERSFSYNIEALGTLRPNEQVDLTLSAADRVTAIYFDDGERVTAGKTLLSLAQREQVALVEAAEATVEETRRQMERVERLAEAQAVSRSELDQARRNLDSAQANLRAVQSRQRDRVLVAPFDGVLGFRQVSVGSFVRPGDVVATLIDDSEMNLDFDVPSVLLTLVRPGTVVLAQTDGLPGIDFEGAIVSLDNAIDPVTRSVRARAALANDDRLLRSGMFMRVTVEAAPRRATAVPEKSVEPFGPDTFVWLAREENGALVARRVKVELGLRQDGYIEVLGGVEPGDQLITEGLIRVREGAPVVVRDPAMLQPQPIAGGAMAPGAATSSN